MENMNISAVNTATEPKHKWLAKGSKIAKKAVLYFTTFLTTG